MIYDSLKNAERYASISGNFAKAFAFLKETDLASLAAGRHEIDGDRVYASVQEPTYKPWQEGKWECLLLMVMSQRIINSSSYDAVDNEWGTICLFSPMFWQ